MRLEIRWEENEMSMKCVAWGMKTMLLGMKHQAQGMKCHVLGMKKRWVWNLPLQTRYETSLHGTNTNSKVWKKFKGMKLFVQGMNFFNKSMKKNLHGMKNNSKVKIKGMTSFLKLWKTHFWIWKNVDFWKFPFSYLTVWKNVLFFRDGPMAVWAPLCLPTRQAGHMAKRRVTGG